MRTCFLSLLVSVVTLTAGAQGHGGTLAVESDEGAGAAFVITVPA